jgi:hypothetical protein
MLEAKLGGQSFGSSPSTSTPATRTSAHLAQGRRHHAARLLRRSERQDLPDLKLVGRTFGMPTTLIVDPAGCEIGTVAGPAEWAGEDAVKLMSAALGRPS